MNTPTRKTAVLMVTVTFEGTYYDAGELVDVASDWIRSGLEDRDDLRGVTISGRVVSETPMEEEAEGA